MSLIDPSWFERQPIAVRIGLTVAAALVVIGAVLFTLDRCSTWRANRDIDKARANVNAAMQEVNAAKATVANDRIDEALALQNVNAAVQDVVNASTATDAAKAEANAALANYKAAVEARRPTGTTEADLDAKLRALGE